MFQRFLSFSPSGILNQKPKLLSSVSLKRTSKHFIFNNYGFSFQKMGLKNLIFSKLDEMEIKKDRFDLDFSIFKVHYDRFLCNNLIPLWEEKVNERNLDRRTKAKESRKRTRQLQARIKEAKKTFFKENSFLYAENPISNENMIRQYNKLQFDSFTGDPTSPFTTLPNDELYEFDTPEQLSTMNVDTERYLTKNQLIEKIKMKMVQAGIKPTQPLYYTEENAFFVERHKDLFVENFHQITDLDTVPTPPPLVTGKRTMISDENPVMFTYHNWPFNKGKFNSDLRERKMVMKVKVSALKLTPPVKERFLQLVEKRYDPETDILTLTADSSVSKTDNKYFVKARLRKLLAEAWKADPNYIPLDPEQIQPLSFKPVYHYLPRSTIVNYLDPKEMEERKQIKEEEQKILKKEENQITIFRLSPIFISKF